MRTFNKYGYKPKLRYSDVLPNVWYKFKFDTHFYIVKFKHVNQNNSLKCSILYTLKNLSDISNIAYVFPFFSLKYKEISVEELNQLKSEFL